MFCKILISIFLLFCSTSSISSSSSSNDINTQYFDKLNKNDRINILNDAIKQIILSSNKKTLLHEQHSDLSINNSVKSIIRAICPKDLKSNNRLGCCRPSHLRILNNIMIKDGKIITFQSNEGQLPRLRSITLRKETHFNMKVENSKQNYRNAGCSSYINGTLHVMGKFTSNNLFHVLNDNVMPLLALIVYDIHLETDHLYLPRLALTGWQPLSKSDEMPHIKMISDILSENIDIKKANGMCFSRLIWGDGPRLIYNHAFIALRREVAQLLRNLVKNLYNPPMPQNFNNASGIISLSSNPLVKVSRPKNLLLFNNMKVVIFSRGTTGNGRSIGGETLLKDALIASGASVTICCDFNSITFEQQLGFGYHADIIIGLHGAGLMNSIFARKGIITVELKTVYGYSLDLFALVTDSREGSHIQINVKDYSTKSGHKPIDDSLINRIIVGLTTAIKFQKYSSSNLNFPQNIWSIPSRDQNGNNKYLNIIHPLSEKGDMILTPITLTDKSEDILGPTISNLQEVCQSFLFSKYRNIIGGNQNEYCLSCTNKL